MMQNTVIHFPRGVAEAGAAFAAASDAVEAPYGRCSTRILILPEKAAANRSNSRGEDCEFGAADTLLTAVAVVPGQDHG